MKVKRITDFEEFRALREPWNELCRRSPDDHAYLRHEWFEHWLTSQDMRGHLHMLTAWQDGLLCGALPLVWKPVQLRGTQFRSLRLAESSVSPRCHVLAPTGEMMATLCEQLMEQRGWQLLELQHLEADSPTTRNLLSCLNEYVELLVNVGAGRQSPYLVMEQSFDEYLKALPSKRRLWIKRAERLLDSAKRTIEVRTVTSEADVELLLDAIMYVSARTWKAGSGTAIHQVPSQKRLYSEFTPVGLRQGLVEAVILYVDGRPWAFDYALKREHHYTGIRTDFDEAFREYSPGEYLRIAILKHRCQSGRRVVIDYGGDVADYKQRWASHMRHHVVVHAARVFSKGAPVVLWKKLQSQRDQLGLLASGVTSLAPVGLFQ